MKEIVVGGTLRPISLNTPLNARARINTLSEVESIQHPAVGEIFYCLETKKLYVINSLKSSIIAGIEMADSVIDVYSEVCSGGTNSGGTGDTGGSILVDSMLSATSTNPVQNKVITTRVLEIEDSLDNVSLTVQTLSGNVTDMSEDVEEAVLTVQTLDGDFTNLSTTVNGFDQRIYAAEQLAQAASTKATDAETKAATAEETAALLSTQIAGKQDTLVSGVNLRTINGMSLLGSGDIVISGGSTGEGGDDSGSNGDDNSGSGGVVEGVTITVDTAITADSTNPVTSAAIYNALQTKVDKETGKGLSTNDFTSAYKSKLDGLDNIISTTVDQKVAELGFGNIVLTQDEYDNLTTYDITRTYVIVQDNALQAIYMGAFLVAYKGSGESGDSQFPYALPIVF